VTVCRLACGSWDVTVCRLACGSWAVTVCRLACGSLSMTVCRLACGSCTFKGSQIFVLKDQGVQENINPQIILTRKKINYKGYNA
jgi:hypothetical protein